MVTLESTVSRILDTLQSNGGAGRTQNQDQSATHSHRTDDSSAETTTSPLAALIGGGPASEQVKMLRRRDIEVLGETYLRFAAAQPLPLFPRENFINSLFERPDAALFAIIANAMRYTERDSASPNLSEACTFRDAAHSLALDQIGRGKVGVSTLQTLCLIIFYDYSSGLTPFQGAFRMLIYSPRRRHSVGLFAAGSDVNVGPECRFPNEFISSKLFGTGRE
jgi:hypothetical protein